MSAARRRPSSSDRSAARDESAGAAGAGRRGLAPAAVRVAEAGRAPQAAVSPAGPVLLAEEGRRVPEADAAVDVDLRVTGADQVGVHRPGRAGAAGRVDVGEQAAVPVAGGPGWCRTGSQTPLPADREQASVRADASGPKHCTGLVGARLRGVDPDQAHGTRSRPRPPWRVAVDHAGDRSGQRGPRGPATRTHPDRPRRRRPAAGGRSGGRWRWS